MHHLTEKAFKDCERAARLLGDMKHGIHEVKTAGGIDDKTKLEALMGFRSQADDILKNMGDSIGEAMYSVDKENDNQGVDSGCASFTVFCDSCGVGEPDHADWCKDKAVSDLK